LDDLNSNCGNYIKMALAVRDVVWESADRTVVAQVKTQWRNFANMAMNLQVL